MPTFTLPGNKNIVFRFFEPLETAHKDDRYVDSGVEIDGRKHTIGIGAGSPLFSADGPEITGPIVDKFTKDQSKDIPTDTQSEDKSEDSSPSEETEDDTSTSVEAEVVPSTEPTSVDTPEEPETSYEVESPQDVIDRKCKEAMDDDGDGTGNTYS